MQENAMMELDVVILGDKYNMNKVSCFRPLFPNLTHKTSLSPPRFIEVPLPNQESDRSRI